MIPCGACGYYGNEEWYNYCCSCDAELEQEEVGEVNLKDDEDYTRAKIIHKSGVISGEHARISTDDNGTFTIIFHNTIDDAFGQPFNYTKTNTEQFSPFTCPFGTQLHLGKRKWVLVDRTPEVLVFQAIPARVEDSKGNQIGYETPHLLMREMYHSEVQELAELGLVEVPVLV